MNNILTDFFKNKNSKTPVWFLRQAGRHIPEYFEIRSKANNFIDFCLNPKLIVETQNVVEERTLTADDQFKNMLEHFYSLITGGKSVFMEYEQNIQQASLIHEFKQLSERN